jgi:hypothetical protein
MRYADLNMAKSNHFHCVGLRTTNYASLGNVLGGTGFPIEGTIESRVERKK